MSRPTLSHRAEYLAYRAAEGFFRLLPVETVFLLGKKAGSLAFHLSSRYRSIVRRNLRIAFAGEKSLAEIDELVRKVFEHTGANLFSSIRTATLEPEELAGHVTISGMELIEKARAEKRGIVLVVPHMGNWEALAQAAALADPDIASGGHYRPLANPLLDAYLHGIRSQRGMILFAKKSSTHRIIAFLKTGGLLGILADLRGGARGDLHPYFGRLTTCPPLPALLANRSGAAILGLSCRTLSPGHWELVFTPVGGTDTAACMESLETACRAAPADVFWFQDRWKLPARRPLFLPHRGETNLPARTPLRVLLLGVAEKFPADSRSDVTFESHEFPASPTPAWLKTLNDSHELPYDLIITKPSHFKTIQRMARPLAIPVTTSVNV